MLFRKFSFGVLFSLGFMLATAQDVPFQIKLAPVTIPGLPGLQSYAVGQSDGKWLILGGRLDGLHRRQPFASFDLPGQNQKLYVVDVENKQVWSASVSSLPTAIAEQLASTNMEFYQEGDYLYLFGGYGYSNTLGDHTTYGSAIAVHVPEVIRAIEQQQILTPWFRQINDSQFQVTGGRLRKMGKVFHLLGGQKFLGRYNPMGPTHGPGFVQEYTNQVRRFTLQDDGTQLQITHLAPFTDSVVLHRRDYNAESQMLPNGSEGITMFSGVFRPDADLPYLTAVHIDSTSYLLDTSFNQLYNHYHCATLPMYSAAENEMHTVFFGGIAQYYEFQGMLIKDDNVPFVKTIGVVSRDSQGKMRERKLPNEMPAFLGAGSEFILNKDAPHYPNEVVQFDALNHDSVLLGYIYGGISSSAANIFFINTGAESSASSVIYKVYLSKGTSAVQTPDASPFGMQVFPNPTSGAVTIEYTLEAAQPTSISLFTLHGVFLEQIQIAQTQSGKNTYHLQSRNLVSGQSYLVSVKSESKLEVKLVVIK